jgi:hypothetical protein
VKRSDAHDGKPEKNDDANDSPVRQSGSAGDAAATKSESDAERPVRQAPAMDGSAKKSEADEGESAKRGWTGDGPAKRSEADDEPPMKRAPAGDPPAIAPRHRLAAAPTPAKPVPQFDQPEKGDDDYERNGAAMKGNPPSSMGMWTPRLARRIRIPAKAKNRRNWLRRRARTLKSPRLRLSSRPEPPPRPRRILL